MLYAQLRELWIQKKCKDYIAYKKTYDPTLNYMCLRPHESDSVTAKLTVHKARGE